MKNKNYFYLRSFLLKVRISKNGRQSLFGFCCLVLLLCATSLSLNAQNTPIAIDNTPANDCAGMDCWDFFNWSPVQDGMGNTIGGVGIAEDNSCGTTIGATVEYTGPDATPDFTGTLVGANTTDGTTPDVWTFSFDVALTNPIFDINSLENDTELCFTDCLGNPLTITILGTSLDPGPSGAHCVTSGTNFVQVTGTYDCIVITGSVPDNDPYTIGVATCLSFNPPPPIPPCTTCAAGTDYELISLDQTGTNPTTGLPTGIVEINNVCIGSYDFLFSDLDVNNDGNGTTFGGWDIDGGTMLLQVDFCDPLIVQQLDIRNLEVESEVSVGTTLTGAGATAVLGGQTLTVCSDPSGRMGVEANPDNGQMNFVKTDGPGCGANPNGSYTFGTNPVSTLYFKYHNPPGGCTGDYVGFRIGTCYTPPPMAAPVCPVEIVQITCDMDDVIANGPNNANTDEVAVDGNGNYFNFTTCSAALENAVMNGTLLQTVDIGCAEMVATTEECVIAGCIITPPCATCPVGSEFDFISLDETGTSGAGFPIGTIEVNNVKVGTYEFLFSDLDVSEDGNGTTFGGWDNDGGVMALRLDFCDPLTVEELYIRNLEVESQVSVGTSISGTPGPGAPTTLGGLDLTFCDGSLRMLPEDPPVNMVITDGPGCGANPNAVYTIDGNPITTLYFQYYNPPGGCRGDYVGFKIGVCREAPPLVLPLCPLALYEVDDCPNDPNNATFNAVLDANGIWFDFNNACPISLPTAPVQTIDISACATTTFQQNCDACCDFTVDCPANTNLGSYDCNQLGNIPAPPATAAQASAAPYNITIGPNPCGMIVVSSVDDIAPPYNVCAMGGQTITRTVTVFDDLNNNQMLDPGEESQDCIYTFDIVEDTTPPDAPAPPADVNVQCATDVPPPVQLTAQDACSGAVTVSPTAMITPGACANRFIMTRTWTFTDACNNSSSVSQTITVFDDTAPTLSAMPTNTTVECDAVPGVPVITATDNCIALDRVLFINEIHYDDTGADTGEFIEIAGTAGTDLSAFELAAYEGSDGMIDGLVQLSGVIPDEGNGFGALAFFLVDLNSQFFENGPREGRALIETGVGVVDFISYEGAVTAVDGPAAGLTATDIGVSENGSDPEGLSLQQTGAGCSAGSFTWTGPTAESPGSLNAGQSFDTNLCSASNNVAVVFTQTINPSGVCPQEYTIIRVWTATDICDNAVSHTQSITVQDNTAPVFCNPPGNLTVNCVAPPAEDVTATDNCDFGGLAGPVWINEIHYDNTGGDVGEFIEIAGVAGTDLSGFELLAYDSDDLLDDQITLSGIIPDESCGFGAIAFFLGDLSSQFFENGPEEGRALLQTGVGVIDFISYEGVVNAANGPAMGLSSFDIGEEPFNTPVGQSLQLIRNPGVPPGFAWIGPADDSPGSLNEDQAGFLVGVLTEADNTTPCDGGTITRTWTVEDACGNAAAPHVQVITVVPPAGPTIVCPVDMTVQCEADIVVDAANATVTTDCGLGFATWVDQPHITGARDCDGTTYEYTYHVVDDCGRGATCIQTWTLQNAAPTITVIPGTTVECAEDIVTDPSDATVTTSCGEVLDVTIYAPVVSGTADCPNTTYTYTYRVEDQCEREATADRVFTIQNAAPTIVAPANTTCECLAGITPNGANATVDVSCDLGYSVSTSIANGNNVAQDCPGATYIVTYTATDDCNRPASATQTYTIQNGPPVFLNAPTVPLQLNCEDEGWENIIQTWLAHVKATNSCGTPLTVLNNYNPNTQGVCIANGTTVVTWRATDQCFRTTTFQSMIIINDTEPPVFTTPAQDELDICNYGTQAEFQAWVAAHGNAVAVDGCDQNITNNQWSTIPNNPQFPNCVNNMGSTTMTVTFVVRDDCGNKASSSATFTALMIGGDMVEPGDNNAEAAQEPGFELYQNQPNPFMNQTLISFNLPEATAATLTVYDISGKVIKVEQGDYNAGFNQVLISRSELSGAGMLYYELRTAKDAAVKKMIIID